MCSMGNLIKQFVFLQRGQIKFISIDTVFPLKNVFPCFESQNTLLIYRSKKENIIS